ncbi:MAG: xanthine dehydrogenase family protein subunit M [Planctomycetota bacterium]
MRPFRLVLPQSVSAAVSACGDSFAATKIMAGGTDLLGEIKEGIAAPESVVNLKTIPGLDRIRRTERGLEIGALVKLSAVAEHDEIRRDYGALATTIGRTATPQLRNVGTLAGNLCQRPRCHYYRHEDYPCLRKGGSMCYALLGENEFHAIFDNRKCAVVHASNTAPVLIGYDAQVEIAGPQGSATVRSLEDFFVGPDVNVQAENVLAPNWIVTTIILPPGTDRRNAAYLEAREKQSFDWALCGATVTLRKRDDRIAESRVVLSAVAPTPQRRRDLEGLLDGQSLTDELVERVSKAATAKASPLAQNAYKVRMLQVTLARALREAWNG